MKFRFLRDLIRSVPCQLDILASLYSVCFHDHRLGTVVIICISCVRCV
jgi:hypothetical protein